MIQIISHLKTNTRKAPIDDANLPRVGAIMAAAAAALDAMRPPIAVTQLERREFTGNALPQRPEEVGQLFTFQ
jgi:hypothetical protein